MGAQESKPPTLTDKQWRKTKDWSKELKHELKSHVAGLAPQIPDEKEQVPFYNVLLTGQIKAGKSSFFNSLYSVFIGKVVSKADVGKAARSLTKEFNIYEVRESPKAPPLSWRICDTMGLDLTITNESDIRNILSAVDGHVPDGFLFDGDNEINPDNPEYINNPSLSDKAHCVAVVIDASQIPVMRNQMWDKLRSLRTGLIKRKVPTYIILTHIDKACEDVNKDVTKVYRSIIIRDAVESVGKKLLGLPENQVFPVMNYSSQIQLDDNVDILLLYALRQMLYSAQAHLENKM